MSYTHPEFLISTEQLNEAINNPSSKVCIFDATVTLVPAKTGYKAVSGLEDYKAAHIPGASFMDLAQEFSDTTSGLGFTLPSQEHLQAAYRKVGIDDDSLVVFYTTGHMMWATRAWWMLKSCGHNNVVVLDGGFAKWQAEGRPISTDTPEVAAGNFTARLDRAYWTDKAQTLAAIDDGDVCTINALAPGVYSGEADMNYGRKGHIKNSKNVYYDEVLENGCFRSAEELTAIFTDKGVLQKPKVIAYCGGGISATIDALALLLIGHKDVAVYDGSMSEWVKDEDLPLVVGNE